MEQNNNGEDEKETEKKREEAKEAMRDQAQAAAQNLLELRNCINNQKLGVELFIENQRFIGTMHAARFNGMLDAGLTRAEALHVLASRGLS